MATGISGRSFLAVVKRSGVVSEEELKRSLAALEERNVPLDDPDALARALIEQGVITRWQAEKMLQGKTKGFFLGPYRLLDMLGKGGMGAVYLGEHTLMRRRCAIKVLPSKNINSRSYLERFYREGQAVGAMDHKNIVRAYDVNQAKVGDADVHFLAMEYVEGRDLQKIIEQDGVLRYTDAAEYMRQSAEGLAHAHEAGMVHRDIKPANLLLNNKGVIKILDLGLAKFYDDEQEASLTVAHQETVLGTADYLAPEQAVDSHNTDHRADIYSLGCTFYFLLTGHPPFCEGSVANRLLQHQIKPPPPIRDDRPDAPDDLLAIIDRMMAKKREERYQSAQDVAEDLTRWLAANGDQAWREQNPDLVRKVGEFTRADTKIVTGAMVDTAELDLKADDDLDLAPLDGATASSPKESPLVAGSPAGPSAAAPEQDSMAELKADETPAPAKPSAAKDSVEQLATDISVQEPTPETIDLPPLEAPALAPLEDLQSFDLLSSNSLTDPQQPGLSPVDNSTGLATNLALSQSATPAAVGVPPRTEDNRAGLPMPWIIGIASVGLLVVLGVLGMMIFGSGDPDPARGVRNEHTTHDETTTQNDPNASPSVAVDTSQHLSTGAGTPQTGSSQIGAPEAGAPQDTASTAPVAADSALEKVPAPRQETAPAPVESPPTVNNLNTPSATANFPADGQGATPAKVEPEKVEPEKPQPKPAPEPSAAVSTPPPAETPPPPAPDAVADSPSPSAPLSDDAKKQLLAKVNEVSIKIDGDLPDLIKPVWEEVRYEALEKLQSAEIKPSDSSHNTLRIGVKFESDQPQQGGKPNPDAKVRFFLTTELSVPDPSGNPVIVWSDSLTNESVLQAYYDRRARKITLPTNLRKEIGTLFRRLAVAKKVGM